MNRFTFVAALAAFIFHSSTVFSQTRLADGRALSNEVGAPSSAATSQYVFKPIDLGPKWTSASGDNQGGLRYSDGAQILHLDQSGGNPQTLFAASEINGWSLTDDYICLGSDVYVVIQRPSQQKQLPPDFAFVRKREAGTAQVLLQTGQQFTFTLASQSVNGTPYYPYSQSGGVISYQSGLFPLSVYSSAGRIFIEAIVDYASGPHAGIGAYVELELNSDSTLIVAADPFNLPQGPFQTWCGTAQYLWIASQVSGSSLWQLWKFNKAGNGQMVGDPINVQGGGCNSSRFAALFLTGGTGNDPLSANIRMWPDAGSSVDLLTKAPQIAGKQIGTFVDFSLLEDGNVFLIQSDNQNDKYLFRIGSDGQDLVKGPQDAPVGEPQYTIPSASATYLDNLEQKTDKLYRLLWPRLTGNQPVILTANVGDTIVVPCADCDRGTVTLGSKTITATAVPAGLSLVVPAGLSGTVPGVLQVGTVTLNFTLVITPMVAPASISAVTAITGDKKNTFGQGELITIWGTTLWLGTASNNGATPLPTQLGCRVTVDGQASPLYYCSPGQINVVLPQKAGIGHHSILIERLAQDGTTESRSTAFDITIAATSPTLLGNSAIPVYLQDVTLDPSGNTFANATTPAHPGDALIIYATGLGLTNPPLSDGVAGVANVAATVGVMVGSESASLLGAVSSPQFPGLFQIAFVVPVDAVPDASGAIAAQLSVNGAAISFTIPIVK